MREVADPHFALAGVLIMESLEHAQKRGATIIAEYLGGALQAVAKPLLPSMHVNNTFRVPGSMLLHP